jgi:hypothetical protein
MKLLQLASLMVMLVGLMSGGAHAQGDCGPTSELVACLPAAEADVQPAAACCAVLQSYLTTATPEACLCQAASTSAFESSGADVQYAIQIPQKCNLSYRAGTQCNGTTLLALVTNPPSTICTSSTVEFNGCEICWFE